jgi:hypothetical protein
MKLELTKAQYKTLLKIMYCGEWVINSHKIKKDKIYEETDQLEQYIFSFAKECGLDNWIEYDVDLDEYFPTQKMEDDLDKFIDMYDERQRLL